MWGKKTKTKKKEVVGGWGKEEEVAGGGGGGGKKEVVGGRAEKSIGKVEIALQCIIKHRQIVHR